MALSYKMDPSRRRKAIIISNKTFTNRDLQFPGAERNVTYITDGLEACGFKVDTYRDLPKHPSSLVKSNPSKKEYTIMERAKKVAKEDHSDADCLVFCINSHGDEGVIYGTDYQQSPKDDIKIQDIVDLFIGDNCRSLVNKPKIFIINACRGKKMDGGVFPLHASRNDSTIPNQPQRISTSADILIFKSSYLDHESYTTGKGSYFMERLGAHLYKHGQVKPLREIFDMVKNDVASYNNQFLFQMPQVEETLRKQIYFGTTPCYAQPVDDRLQSDLPEMMKEEGGNKLTMAEMTDRTCQRGIMKEEDGNKITNNWEYIQVNIKDKVSKLAKDLMRAHVIDLNDRTILDNIPDASEKADKLLQILLGRGHQAYQGFLSCLRTIGFDHLADVINGDQEPPSIRSRPRGLMAEEDLEKVRVNYGALKDQMDGNLVSGKLLETGVFDTNDREQIINAPAAQQNEVLLTLLINCGPEAFKKFLSCLEKLEYAELKRNLENGTSSTVGSQRRRRGLIPEVQQLREKRGWFLRNISNPEEVATTLHTQSIFEYADLKKVEGASRECKVGVLLDIVRDCGTGAYDSFMRVLRSSGYDV